MLLNDILRVAEDQLDLEEEKEAKKSKLSTLTHDHQRVLELFRRIAREWSEEGAEERKQSFGLLGRNSIEKNGFGPVLGPVFRPKLGQASICFQVVHTCVLFNFAFRASFGANFRANIYFY